MDRYPISRVDHLDSPEGLRLELFDAEISINHKAQGGKLAGAITDDFIGEQISQRL
jgi:hypothetical protein